MIIDFMAQIVKINKLFYMKIYEVYYLHARLKIKNTGITIV